MDKNKLGRRFVCFNCGCRFYDMSKEEAICPKCQTNQANTPEVEQKLSTKVKPKKIIPKEIEPEVEETETTETSEFTGEGLDIESEDLDGFTVEE